MFLWTGTLGFKRKLIYVFARISSAAGGSFVIGPSPIRSYSSPFHYLDTNLSFGSSAHCSALEPWKAPSEVGSFGTRCNYASFSRRLHSSSSYGFHIRRECILEFGSRLGLIVCVRGASLFCRRKFISNIWVMQMINENMKMEEKMTDCYPPTTLAYPVSPGHSGPNWFTHKRVMQLRQLGAYLRGRTFSWKEDERPGGMTQSSHLHAQNHDPIQHLIEESDELRPRTLRYYDELYEWYEWTGWLR